MQWSSKIIAGLQSLERSEVNEDEFVICYSKQWASDTLPALRRDKESRLWIKQLPKTVASRTTLDDTSKPLPGIKSYLKNPYKDTNKHSSLTGNNDFMAQKLMNVRCKCCGKFEKILFRRTLVY